MKKTLPIAISLLAAMPLLAQEPPARQILAERPGLKIVMDNDGGRVEVFHHGEPARNLQFHGGAVIRDPIVEIVFLGDGWSNNSMQQARAALRSAAGHVTVPDDSIRPAAIAGERALPGSAAMNDLQIQVALDRAMTAGTLSLRDENVIRVIFVAPDLKTSLGDARPGSDYDSYHSHFHTQDVNVRYVVVPFDGDIARASDAAAKSLTRAILNPDGDGWY